MCPTMQSTYPDNSKPNDIFGTNYISANLSVKGPQPATLRRTKSTDKTKTLLPLHFQPTEYSVICGNKRAFFNSIGNRRFRVICQMHIAEYMTAPSKHEKSFVVTKVMKTIRDACPIGSFITFEKGRWWEVSDRTSREKVGTFFRDCLSDTYKSSSKNKIAQRKKKRACSPPSSPVPTTKPMINFTLGAGKGPMTPLISAALQVPKAPFIVTPPLTAPTHVTLPSRSLQNDETSIGSSNGSFYSIDDLTPLYL